MEETTVKRTWPVGGAGILDSVRRHLAVLLVLVFGLASSGSEHGEGLYSRGARANLDSGPAGITVPRDNVSSNEGAGSLDGRLLAAAGGEGGQGEEGTVYAACWATLRKKPAGAPSYCTSTGLHGVVSRVVSIHRDDLEDVKDIWGLHVRNSRESKCNKLRRWNCVAAKSKLRAKAAAARELAEQPTTDSSADDTEFL